VVRRIVASLCTLIWGFCGYVGFGLVSAVTKQGAAGYPNTQQWELYVVLPAAMALLGIALVIFAKRAPTALYAGLLIVEIVPILPFLLVSGGGV
jgi:predicted cobalt transporter CbtA